MSQVIVLTDASFESEVLQSDQPVLVDLWAPWCGPCRMIAPAVEELATEFEGRAKITKLNVDEHPETAGRYHVRAIPTLLLFKGGAMVEQVVGVVPKATLAEKLQALLEPQPAAI